MRIMFVMVGDNLSTFILMLRSPTGGWLHCPQALIPKWRLRLSPRQRYARDMPFLQLEFESSAFDPEEFEAACFAAGALSVTLTDAANEPILEPEPYTTPLWSKVRVRVLFAEQASRSEILTALPSIPPEHIFTEIADRAWEREWLVDFRPMRFGARLWVCPHEKSVAAKDAVVVKLDPGLRFGTGTHATTAKCLQWLDGADL